MSEQFDPNQPFEPADVEFDPSQPYEPEDPHALWPFLKQAGKGFGQMLSDTASGIGKIARNPGDTAVEVAESFTSATPEGYYRALRHTPVIGDVVNHAVIAAQGIPGYLRGGDSGQLQAVNAQDRYERQQNEADVAHAAEHPLTDFIQKSAGVIAMPGGHIAQTSALSVDAFTRSLNAGNDVLTALQDARNAAVLMGASLGATKGIAKGVSGATKATGRYLAKEAGVKPEAIARYKQDPVAVNNAAKFVDDPEALKNLVDNRVAPINDAVDVAKMGVDDSRGLYNQSRREPPLSLAEEIPKHLDTQGEKLSNLSMEAIDRLAAQGETFPIGKIRGAVTSRMNALKIDGVEPTVGPDASAYRGLGVFRDMVDRIGDQNNGNIPAATVKQIIQQLDKVSKEAYQVNAGGIGPEAATNFARVRRNLDRVLKDSSLEPPNEAGIRVPTPGGYAEKMAELAPQVRLVSDLSKAFGATEESALNVLKAAADPSTPRGYTVRKKLADYDQANGTDFAQRVADYYDAPKANLERAKQHHQSAKQLAAGVNKIGPNSTETTLGSIQGGRNWEARKQLEALDPDLAQTVQDAGVARQFARATINGSRKAKIGAGIGASLGSGAGALLSGSDRAAGAVVGGTLGGGIGGYLGGLADMYGGQAVKAALDAGIKLERLQGTPYVAQLMRASKEGNKQLAIVHYMLMQTDPKYQATQKD